MTATPALHPRNVRTPVPSAVANDVERAALASLFVNPSDLGAVRKIMQPQDLADRRHERLYSAILRVADSGRPIDELLVIAELERVGELRDAGGKEYVAGLLGEGAFNATHYATLAVDAAKRRGLRALLADVANQLDTAVASPADLAEQLVRRVSILTQNRSPAGRRLRLSRIMEGVPPAPPEMLVQKLILAGDVNLWAGHGGAGKSTLLFYVAVCLSLGLPAFGTLDVRRAGPVVLLVPEDGASVARMILDAIAAGLELEPQQRATLIDRLIVVHEEEAINLLKDIPSLRRAVEETNAVALIADPLTNLLGSSDENAPETSTDVCDLLRREICRSTGAAVILSHHFRKASKDSQPDAAATVSDVRGGGGWSNGTRLVIGVTRRKDSDEVVLEVFKSNRIKVGTRHDLSLSIDADPENEALWRAVRVVDRNVGAMSQTLTPGVGRQLNDNEQKALRILDDRHEPGRQTSWSEWTKTSGLKADTLKSVKTRLLDAALVEARVTGKHKNGGNLYAYALSERGRSALETGWTFDAPKGERVR